MLSRACLIFVVSCIAPLATLAASDDERFLAGLRERRLFALAEEFCREQLTRPGLTSTVRAELAIEQSRTLVEHALHVLPAEREPLWKQAAGVIEQITTSEPKHPRLPLLQTQSALVKLAQGELARQEAELIAAGPTQLADVRTTLRAAIERFDAVSKLVDEQLRDRNLQRDAPPQALTASELQQLQKHVALYRARALRQQGESYPTGTPDRIAALTRAVSVLEPLVGLDPSDPICWASRVDEIICWRLLNDRATAVRRIEALDELKPPPEVLLRVRAETVRMLLATQQTSAALELIEGELPSGNTRSADWDYAVLEAVVSAWREASGAQRQTDTMRWQQAAAEQIRRIDLHYGAYWSRRAEMLLATHTAAVSGVGDLDVLLRSAESFFRAGQIEQALKTYDDLVQRAIDAQQPQRAFDAGFTAAAIEQQRTRHESAAGRFRRTALAHASLAKAPEAHLAAIWNTAKAYSQPTAEQRELYRQLLAEHVQHWHSGATVDQVRLWSGQLHEAARNWTAARDDLRAISAASPLRDTALEVLGRVELTVLAEERAAQRSTETLAIQAASYFEQSILRGGMSWPERWTTADRIAAVAAARIWLEYAPGKADRAERLLTTALQHAAEAAPEWLTQTQLLAIQAWAATGNVSAGLELAGKLAGADHERLLTLLDALQRRLSEAPRDQRAAVAQLMLDLAAKKSSEPPLSADQQRRFDLCRGLALTAVERRDEALKLLAALSQKHANDAVVQEAYALAVSAGATQADHEAALVRWREVERRSPPGSERWFRAKLQLAQTHLKLGNKERARQIVELTKLLHPQLGGATLERQFAEVLRQAQP